jgi:hypothetical protein
VSELNELPLPDTLVNTPFVAPMLPTLALPVAFSVPATLTPVPVITAIFALPALLILTLPFADGILTFELPFESDVPIGMLVSKEVSSCSVS